MTYKELQEKAKELGLPYVGVSKDNLEKSIEEANVAPQDGEGSAEPEKPAEPEQLQKTKTEKKTKKGGTVAIIYNGNNEVRRYDAETHGDNFADLANEFATKKDYRVEIE